MTNKFKQLNHIEPDGLRSPEDHFCRLRSVQGGMLVTSQCPFFCLTKGGLHEQNQTMVISQVAQGKYQPQAQAVNDLLDSRRTVTWREVGEDMNCNHCSGLVVSEEFYNHGVWHREYRCLMCGRYWPIETRRAYT